MKIGRFRWLEGLSYEIYLPGDYFTAENTRESLLCSNQHDWICSKSGYLRQSLKLGLIQ